MLPYLDREFGLDSLMPSEEPSVILSADPVLCLPDTADFAVMLSSTEVYARKDGTDIPEDSRLDTLSPWYAREQAFSQACALASVPCAILRCANIVGTGMNGLAMRLAHAVWRGWPLHLAGNEAVVSAVHAVDVARLVRLVLGTPCVVNVTDGVATPVDLLIEAFAYRLDNKRVASLGTKQTAFAKLIYGKRNFALLTTSLTYADDGMKSMFPDFRPNVVTDYLKTHVYDDESL